MPDEARWRFGWWLDQWRVTTREQRRTGLLAAGSALVGLAVAATSVVASGPWDSGQRTAERQRAASGARTGGGQHGPGPAPAPSAALVLAPLGAPTQSPTPRTGEQSVPMPTGPGLSDALGPLLKDDALGPLRAGAVVDAATGRQLFDAKANSAAVPASVIKLVTGVAALSALGPGHRLTTTVATVPGDTGRIVLVGGGDPTLTARATHGPESARPASLRQLADDTARALGARDQRNVRLDYDTSLYSGPVLHPIGPNENLAPVTALMADEGRRDDSERGPADRAKDPAADAARTFAGLLRDRGIKVTGDPRHHRRPGAAAEANDAKGAAGGRGANGAQAGEDDQGSADTTLATVRSQPLSALVERALTNSDNDIAEALARHTALATGRPASFAGARDAVTAQLKKLGLPVAGARFADGSGLDRDDKVSSALLAQVLVRAADPGQPALRPVLTGLPIAGFTGTLRDRYAKDAVGRGVVRAKTGTLTGVNTLAGTVVDADGRLLTFAFVTNGTDDPHAAQRALDRLASALANCGCR
ncbi:D-alanyl-D-alanine carboxypeptidase/D-alanyl-D-alanine endopeptidase [Streptomyces zagrosensis]|uniref:D-alanyl-D-alanine carboxypeptidase/D-alanyl-D-alanine-endopeptidase (Penicillin-binding protein 4) n=1 Tax=Streptomyces zagrosensis TaxID=1042984 RepID=A0A7W9V1K0_9ACTN|nr:D-alanyl-D-alanine carboxypeptidase/D-alanyl-D-alanine-endopeptidase [Streptomyces zagrosensis]MBB5939378.1 D-alanyl-D-alanine carboxypeptidase/D-alanyl-D-alanine-endopeptidase (penicillin-binding protein 4) [Streptomyces zagrosensis]